MSLDIRLRRTSEAEPWGFRLVGGADSDIPLTVVKVQPSSPADQAGLKRGDTLAEISGVTTEELTHVQAQEVIGRHKLELAFAVERGKYDMVVDDEDIYIPIDQLEDFDLPSSEPTEVFRPIQVPDLSETRDTSRSLTESPFLQPTKPYRPFSTEPIPEIPPIEDPIILNPEYHDVFGDIDEECLPKTRFKLPISEQYKPDQGLAQKEKKKEELPFKIINCDVVDDEDMKENVDYMNYNQYSQVDRKENLMSEVIETSIKETKTSEEIFVTQSSETKISEQTVGRQVMSMEEIQELERMSREVEFETVEETASRVVRESIERALNVAEEIKQEIDTELSTASKLKKESNEKRVVASTVSEKKDTANMSIVSESKHDAISLTEVQDSKLSNVRQEINETIEAGKVKKLSDVFEHSSDVEVSKAIESTTKVKPGKFEQKYESKEIEGINKVKSSDVERQSETVNKVSNKTEQIKERNVDSVQETKQTSNTTSTSAGKTTQSDKKYSTAKLLAEQRAYTIGLQTIPKIRGTLHSSYQYNLLLKTFFIHLTDVMVALSRFILTEPALSNLEDREQETVTETKTEQVISEKNVNVAYVNIKENVMEQKETHLELAQEVRVSDNVVSDKQLAVDTDHLVEKRKISGSKMAQRTEQKTEELTTRMDAVITEFQTKAGVDDNPPNAMDNNVVIKEEIVQDLTTNVKELSSHKESVHVETAFDNVTTQKLETVHTEAKSEVLEINEERRSKSKDRIMYVATVESHVYTNKDEILEDHAMSDTSSLQSVEATNIVDVTEQVNVSQSTNLETNKTIDETNLETKKVDVLEIKEATVSAVKEIESVEVNAVPIIESVVTEHTIKSNQSELSTGVVNEDVQGLVLIKKEVELEQSQDLEVLIEDELVMKTQIVELSEENAVLEKIDTVTKEECKSEVMQTESSKIETFEEQSIDLKSMTESFAMIKEEDLKEEKVETIVSNNTESMFDSKSETTQILQTESKQEQMFAASVETKSEIKQEEIKTQEAKTQTFTNTTNVIQNFEQQETKIQESSFTARTTSAMDAITKTNAAIRPTELPLKIEQPRRLTKTDSSSSFPSTIDTPTPATIPPTPLTDEYMFRLQFPMPKNPGIPEPRTPTPEIEEPDDEDPHIVKKRLIPHIETNIERIVYDPPLQTPPVEGKNEPSYSNGNRRASNGKGVPQDSQEEILEIGRKSSLLASAIDETIKSIEEYKEQVGMETKRLSIYSEMPESTNTVLDNTKTEVTNEETKKMYNGYVKEATTTVYTEKLSPNEEKVKMELDWAQVIGQLKNGNGAKPSEIASATSDSLVDKTTVTSNIIDVKSEDVNVEETFETLTSTSNVQETEIVTKDVKQTMEFLTEFASQSSERTETMKENVSESIDNTIMTSSIQLPVVTSIQSEVKTDPMQGYRPVHFDPNEIQENVAQEAQSFVSMQTNIASQNVGSTQSVRMPSVDPDGETIGTIKGIVNSLDDTVLNAEIAKQLGKAGMSEDKIAELISGESEMLREAHVMGLSRVIASHMSRVDDNDSSVDFKKIKPTIERLKDSEVIKALNEELTKTKVEVKKDERKWTTFLQKPKRPVPVVKFGYHGWTIRDEVPSEPYKVKIVKQPKPKVAPDYKPEDFETGLLPWEERAATEPPPPPVDPEDPILIPEEGPEFLEAVDPLPESEVPDLEDTGIELPPEKEEVAQNQQEVNQAEEEDNKEVTEVEEGALTEQDIERAIEETEKIVLEDMEKNLAEQLVSNVQSMVDPNASLEQQLVQMRQQLAALAQLPSVIQQTLELVTKQLSQITQETTVTKTETVVEETTVETSEKSVETVEEEQTTTLKESQASSIEVVNEEQQKPEETVDEVPQCDPVEVITHEVNEAMRKEVIDMAKVERKIEMQKKEVMDQMQLELNSRQVKQHPTPRVGKPKPMFGPLTPQERPLVLPGGRKWRKPQDAYNEQFIAETLTAQAEIIQGKAMGSSFESYILPYDPRINFMKYEKPPVSLDHLKESDVYKLVHNMEAKPVKRVEMLTPVVAECDYREKCRSMTPCVDLQP